MKCIIQSGDDRCPLCRVKVRMTRQNRVAMYEARARLRPWTWNDTPFNVEDLTEVSSIDSRIIGVTPLVIIEDDDSYPHIPILPTIDNTLV